MAWSDGNLRVGNTMLCWADDQHTQAPTRHSTGRKEKVEMSVGMRPAGLDQGRGFKMEGDAVVGRG